MEPTDTTVERGSGNVFADLGFPDADAHLVKAELISHIDDIVRDRGITQTEAARLMGLSQPDVSRLLRGDFREYSLCAQGGSGGKPRCRRFPRTP